MSKLPGLKAPAWLGLFMLVILAPAHATGDITLISKNNTPAAADGASTPHSVSADGRFTVFTSDADDLVPGQVDTNGVDDVFLYDANTDSISLISHTGNGINAGNGQSGNPVISADGSTIAFDSRATDLVDGFQNNNGTSSDVFVSQNGVISLVSHIPGNDAAGSDGNSFGPGLSGDGNVVAFTSTATDLVTGFQNDNGFSPDVFADIAGTMTLISHDASDTTAGGDDFSQNPVVSGDGTVIAFVSGANNLITGFNDNNDTGSDVFARGSGGISLVSHIPSDSKATGDRSSLSPSISDDGSKIVFESSATDLIGGFVNNNGFDNDIFISDSGTISLVSHVPGNAASSGNDQSSDPLISSDGSTAVFVSQASNLVSDDNNGETDVFLYRGTGVELVSHVPGAPQTTANGQSSNPTVSGDGGLVVFESTASNLVAGFENNSQGEFAFHDLDVYASLEGIVRLLNHLPNDPDATGNAAATKPLVSQNGAAVIFASNATDLTAVSDNNNALDVFLSPAPKLDFGDAPEPYPTLLEDDGARHLIGPLFMGAAIDADDDGQPNAAATGDDNDTSTNDEDGVTFGPLVIGGLSVPMTVVTSQADNGIFNAWIDFNKDGDWDDGFFGSSEKVASNVPISGTSREWFFSITDTAEPGDTFARIRMSSDGDDETTGVAADGEVEDYQVTLVLPTLSINDATLVEGDSGQQNLSFTVTLSQAVSQDVSFDFTTGDSTATLADSDYEETMGSMTIDGSNPIEVNTTATINVPINGDTKFENDETFFVTLSNPAGAEIANSQGVGTIENDDAEPVNPDLKVSASELDFGSVNVNSSGTQGLTVINEGNAPLDVTNIGISGTDASQFGQSNDCTALLNPGEDCTVTVDFSPDSTGEKQASLDIASNDPDEGDVSVALSGSAVPATAPVIVVQDALDFGSVEPGNTSQRSLQVANNGDADLVISNVSVGGTDAVFFNVTNDACTGTLAPAQACDVEMSFMPGDEGQKTAALTIESNDPATASAEVELTGEGGNDMDGASNDDEAGVPNPDGGDNCDPNGTGDGNCDGIPDNQQDNVASTPTTRGDGYITVVAEDSVELRDVSTSRVEDGEVNNFIFPVGFFGFTVENVPPGTCTTVTIILDDGASNHFTANAADNYFKFGPTPSNPSDHFYRFDFDGTTGAQAATVNGQDAIKLTLCDGLRGDHDLAVNGSIEDPGGPGVESDTSEDDGDDGSRGGDSGDGDSSGDDDDEWYDISGCSLSDGRAPFDPLLLIMLAVSIGWLKRQTARSDS